MKRLKFINLLTVFVLLFTLLLPVTSVGAQNRNVSVDPVADTYYPSCDRNDPTCDTYGDDYYEVIFKDFYPSDTSIEISWTMLGKVTDSDVATFKIYLNDELVGTTPWTTTVIHTYSITDLPPMTGYTVKVEAILNDEVVASRDSWARTYATPTFFEDAALEQAVRNSLYIQDRPLELSDFEGVTYLSLSRYGITSLKGIELFPDLEYISMSNNRISDLTPLANLDKLEALYAGNNLIEDLSPLKNLSNLANLSLRNNQISDLTPITNLTLLSSLDVADNQISDSAPISNLTTLTSLDLTGNRILDLAPIATLTNLLYLNVGNNQLTDISSLSTLTNLENLHAPENSISDISMIPSLPNLEVLDVRDNNIADISSLQGLEKLIHLDLSQNPISDFDVLLSVPNLRHVSLYGITFNDTAQNVVVTLLSKSVRVLLAL